MRIFMIISLLTLVLSARSQTYIEPRKLEVTANKTTNLVFPAMIISIDRGNERIIVQKATAFVLRIKAESVFADTTNLTVITSDGKLYSFLVSYAVSPSVLGINLGAAPSVSRDTALLALVNATLKMKNNLYAMRCRNGYMLLTVAGIYTTGVVLVCKLRLENLSALSYEIGRIHIYVRDANTDRRRSSQEREIVPLLVTNDESILKEKTARVLSVVLPKLSLVDGQKLYIEIHEKEDGRNLSLGVSGRYMLNATTIK